MSIILSVFSQPIYMRTLLIIIFTIFLMLTILTYPIKIKGVFHIDVFNNVGFIVFKVFFINLVCQKLSIAENGRVVIETKKIPKEKTEKQAIVSQEYYKCLLNCLEIKTLEFYFTGGAGSNAYFVSMLCGTVMSLSSSLFCYLKSKYGRIKIINEITPDFNEDKLQASVCTVVRFSLLDMIKSISCAYRYEKLKEKEKKVG